MKPLMDEIEEWLKNGECNKPADLKIALEIIVDGDKYLKRVLDELREKEDLKARAIEAVSAEIKKENLISCSGDHAKNIIKALEAL